jgi:hypothetical protein
VLTLLQRFKDKEVAAHRKPTASMCMERPPRNPDEKSVSGHPADRFPGPLFSTKSRGLGPSRFAGLPTRILETRTSILFSSFLLH